jgi:hypothetical protein
MVEIVAYFALEALAIPRVDQGAIRVSKASRSMQLVERARRSSDDD